MNTSRPNQTNQIINVVISQTALTSASFKESIDLALVCAAFDQTVNIIFIDNGVYNIVQNQSYQELNDKNHLDILKGLEFYDIDNIYAEIESLDRRNITSENIINLCQTLTSVEIKKLYFQANHVVNI
ncbi:MAG: tRNA 2-thiouridine synthesizing protein C [Polaribacter sp.]|jgi:tRNA 2-thiouridine synthesizing protein C